MSRAMMDVVAERRRQIEKEGYSVAHDDEHSDREIARAGFAYVMHYTQRAWVYSAAHPDNYTNETDAAETADDACFPDGWRFKPKDPRRDLVRAAALIIAEIERLDRLPATTPEGTT